MNTIYKESGYANRSWRCAILSQTGQVSDRLFLRGIDRHAIAAPNYSDILHSAIQNHRTTKKNEYLGLLEKKLQLKPKDRTQQLLDLYGGKSEVLLMAVADVFLLGGEQLSCRD